MANNSSLSKRAALRQQQEMQERTKRTRRILAVGAGLAALTVVAVLAIVIMQALARQTPVAAQQLTPPNATAKHGILAEGKQPSADKPHLVMYQDYQCGWCAVYEEHFGAAITQLVNEDRITAEYRTAFFLDGQSEIGPSRRAALAAAAADEVGFYSQYHQVLYANFGNQADAYPDSELRDSFARSAGMSGDVLSRFQELYDSRAFLDFTQAAGDQFSSSGLTGTPAYLVSGQQLNLVDSSRQPVIDPSADALFEMINQAWEAGGRSNED